MPSYAFEKSGLVGPVPPELGNLSRLAGLNLSSNDLSGTIPPELGSLTTYLRWLDLSSNSLSGAIPPELGNLARLETLTLTFNDLAGPIPPELASLTRLQRPGTRILAGNDLCAPDDHRLRNWLIDLEVYPFPCPADPDVRLLPRALMREDGNGLSLVLPDDLRDSPALTISDPSVVAASVADGWLDLRPQGRGSAEVMLVSSDGETRATAVAVVRAAVGTFGIDIVMDQPAPLGYEEAMTAAADWWSSALNGTEWPDRQSRCGTQSARALADEILIQAGRLEVESNLAGVARTCFDRGSSENVAYDPFGGRIDVIPFVAGHVDVMRHEIGHLLGLVLWASGTGLITLDYTAAYFIGPKAVEVFRAGGGDPNLPGVPFEPTHWFVGAVQCELMTWIECGYRRGLIIDEPDAISLAALADAGYTVDMSKATPWPRPSNAQADAVGERLIDHVVIEWVGGKGSPP